jgi:hypothetical protein
VSILFVLGCTHKTSKVVLKGKDLHLRLCTNPFCQWRLDLMRGFSGMLLATLTKSWPTLCRKKLFWTSSLQQCGRTLQGRHLALCRQAKNLCRAFWPGKLQAKDIARKLVFTNTYRRNFVLDGFFCSFCWKGDSFFCLSNVFGCLFALLVSWTDCVSFRNTSAFLLQQQKLQNECKLRRLNSLVLQISIKKVQCCSKLLRSCF